MRCRGSVVVYQLPNGDVGHWSLEHYIQLADAALAVGDGVDDLKADLARGLETL